MNARHLRIFLLTVGVAALVRPTGATSSPKPARPAIFDFGFRILDFGLPTDRSLIQNPKSKIQNPKSARAGVPSAARPQREPSGALFRGRIEPVLAQHCLRCHGENRTSGLDLRTREAALRGGTRGADIVAGNAAGSRLYRLVAGREQPHMPPGPALPPADVAAIRDWINGGAAWSDGAWWAFRPVRRAAPPAIRSPWIRNPIDAFVLEALQRKRLSPAPPADRVTLIRRVTYDLWGLPPTPEEVTAFVADTSPDAYERLVDRLLASPRYGERWARHWLDLTRYAESEGFKADETRPNAWRYRDYVIRAFNEDKPFSRFIREQIAGDEIAPDDPQALIATGFNRHWADESNARNQRQRRQEILNDITDTVGATFLGLTVGCARCHNHKYDPFSQKDYYRLQAFFAGVWPRDDIPLLGRAEQARHRQQMAAWETQTAEPRASMAALEGPYRDKLYQDKKEKFPADVQEAIETAPEKRTALQWQLALHAAPQVEVKADEVVKSMKPEEREQWKALETRLVAFAPLKPEPLPTGQGIFDVGREAPPTHTLSVGVYDAPLEEVAPGFPLAIDASPPRIVPPAGLKSTGRRTALANWLANDTNPLTPRVIVNRLWQQHFGRGLVASASDFGRAGEPPTHPELLDWLASELVRDRWHLKALHRLMLTSNAYRQSTAFNAAAAHVDPDNHLLWRMRRRRLEGEALRDAVLAVSGDLNPKMGGPSVMPELPEGIGDHAGWKPSPDPQERSRRSIYVFVKRNLRYPLFEAFDMPDTHEPCARRNQTTTAPQALMLLNSRLILREAQSFAGRLLRDTGAGAGDTEGRVELIDRAYRLALGRGSQPAERQMALQFMARQTSLVRARLAQGEPAAFPSGVEALEDLAAGAALVDFCHTLFNTNEFLYVD